MTSSNIVKLNVGGTIFQTSRSTLTKYNCMFRAMLESGIPLETDESGSIFIDRDPTHFRYILNFMRDGTVELPENPKEIKEILKEAEYFSLQIIFDSIETHRSVCRVAKNLAELKTILVDATRNVLVLIFPSSFDGSNINHANIKDFAMKHKSGVNVVLIENPERTCLVSAWTAEYHPIDSSKRPKKYLNSISDIGDLDRWILNLTDTEP